MQYYPLPNINVGTPSYNRFVNYFASYSNTDSKNRFGIKIDHAFSEKDRLAVRFTRRTEYQFMKNVYGNPLDPVSLGDQQYNAYQGVLNYTHILNPKTLLNVSLGYITNPVKSGKGVLDTSYPSFDISKTWDSRNT